MTKLLEATKDDLNTIVSLLHDMAEETKEIGVDKEIFKSAVLSSFDEHVHWFLFVDENNEPFGTCYCQSVHNYWRLEKRFYLGGFYIRPTHRGKGAFRALNTQLKEWVSQNGGTQIYVHIHDSNEQSLGSFKTIGFEPIEYGLYVNHWDKSKDSH